MKTEQLGVWGEVPGDVDQFFQEVAGEVRSLCAKRFPAKILLGFSDAILGVKEKRHEQSDNRLWYLTFIVREAGLWDAYVKELNAVLEHGLPEFTDDEDVCSFGELYDHCLAVKRAVVLAG